MNVIYTYGGILLGHRKEGSTDTGYNADVPQNRVLRERRESQQVLCCMNPWMWKCKRCKSRETEADWWLGRRERSIEYQLFNACELPFGGDGDVLELNRSGGYQCTKCFWVGHLKWVNFYVMWMSPQYKDKFLKLSEGGRGEHLAGRSQVTLATAVRLLVGRLPWWLRW